MLKIYTLSLSRFWYYSLGSFAVAMPLGLFTFERNGWLNKRVSIFHCGQPGFDQRRGVQFHRNDDSHFFWHPATVVSSQ